MVCVSTGTHSLHYHYLTLSEPGPGLPRFLAVVYMDDQPFQRYDSRVGGAEPQAPWMASMDSQYWETETQKHRAWAEMQQADLWNMMSYYNQTGGASGGPPTPFLPSGNSGCSIQPSSLSKGAGMLLRCGSSQSPPPQPGRGHKGLQHQL